MAQAYCFVNSVQIPDLLYSRCQWPWTMWELEIAKHLCNFLSPVFELLCKWWFNLQIKQNISLSCVFRIQLNGEHRSKRQVACPKTKPLQSDSMSLNINLRIWYWYNIVTKLNPFPNSSRENIFHIKVFFQVAFIPFLILQSMPKWNFDF